MSRRSKPKTKREYVAPPPEPFKPSSTVIDPLLLAVQVIEMDRVRGSLMKTLRSLAEDMNDLAARIEEGGLDVWSGTSKVSVWRLNEMQVGLVQMETQQETLKQLLGKPSENWDGKLETHPQVVEALKLYPSYYRTKEAKKDGDA